MICYNCPKRHLYCHSTCDEYAKYKKKCEKLLKQRHYEADYRAAKRATVGRIIKRIRRRKSR